MAYPIGERHGGSILTLISLLTGCVVLYRRSQLTTLTLLVAPLGLGLVAAFLGRYPYGGAPRIMLYAAPSICLLMGLGLAEFLILNRRPKIHAGSSWEYWQSWHSWGAG